MREFKSVSDFGYSADEVDWLRPPEIEGETGKWSSRWLLRVQAPEESVRRDRSLGPPHPGITFFKLTPLTADEVRLHLVSPVHPLEPEGYPVVDAVLRWVDDRFGILSINGSERDKWRTFR